MLVRLLCSGILLLTFAACEDVEGCTPTTTDAREGAVLDVTNPARSSVLEARLTAGAGLPGKRIEFHLTSDDQSELLGEGETGADGTARFDLKKTTPTQLVRTATSAEFRARFDGDATHCSSEDEAPVRVVRV